MSELNYLLQKDIPSNKWLVKDDNKNIIRAVSSKIKDPKNLTPDQELVMKKLIDFVRASQDEEFNIKGKEDYLRPAVGLAAPQIGTNIDMFYVRVQSEENGEEEYAMINTQLVSSSAKIAYIEDGEGCLSVDNDWQGIVPRAWKIIVKGYDWLSKSEVTLTLRNYQAVVFQHEMDHNIGKLYYDKINQQNPEFVGEEWVNL